MWHSSEDDIERVVIRYFRGLFSTTQSNDNDMKRALEGLKRMVSDEMNRVQNFESTAEEYLKC